jgi:hypothetical protein
MNEMCAILIPCVYVAVNLYLVSSGFYYRFKLMSGPDSDEFKAQIAAESILKTEEKVVKEKAKEERKRTLTTNPMTSSQDEGQDEESVSGRGPKKEKRRSSVTDVLGSISDTLHGVSKEAREQKEQIEREKSD